MAVVAATLPAINCKVAVNRFGRSGWSLRHASIAVFSSRGKVMVLGVLYALGRPPVAGLDPRLRRAVSHDRFVLVEHLRTIETLFTVFLRFIKIVSPTFWWRNLSVL
jgi:hypothetical protein